MNSTIYLLATRLTLLDVGWWRVRLRRWWNVIRTFYPGVGPWGIGSGEFGTPITMAGGRIRVPEWHGIDTAHSMTVSPIAVHVVRRASVDTKTLDDPFAIDVLQFALSYRWQTDSQTELPRFAIASRSKKPPWPRPQYAAALFLDSKQAMSEISKEITSDRKGWKLPFSTTPRSFGAPCL